MARKYELTDRESYLVSQALLYAMRYIQGQPEEHRELSNLRDMYHLFGEKFPSSTLGTP